MQTIAIISDHHDWHSNQLEFFLKQNKFETIKVTLPAEREAGVIVETVDELIDKLKNEAKVIS